MGGTVSTTPPNLFSIEDAPSGGGFEISDSTPAAPVTGDTAMAQANTRMALANVPRPANPIDQAEPSAMLSPQLQAMPGAMGRIVQQGARDLYDTSVGSIQNVYQKNYGTPAEQAQATSRLHAAAKNAVTNYMGGMVGEELSPARPFTQAKSPMVPKLLNASGSVTPETLQALQQAEPALRAAGAPADMTQAGMASHARNLSLNIDRQIAPVIKANATRDVAASTAKIAADLRAEITPEMKRINPGTANVIEKTAKSLEDAKTLGSLDEVRQQLNDRVLATKSRTVSKQYLGRALENVRSTIADHAQQVRPDLPVRAMRTQQSALMKLADTFEGSAAKGATEEASQQGLTMRQRAGQMLPKAIKAYTNPKAALAEKLLKPSTAEDFIQQAFQGHRPQAPVPIPQPVPDMPAATPADVSRMVNQAAAREPGLANWDAMLKQRAAAYQAQGEAMGGIPLKSQVATTTPSTDISPSVNYYERYGQQAAPANTPEATVQHMTAFQQARQQLGPNATISEILQAAAKIQNPR